LLSHGDQRLTPALSTTQINRGFVRVWPELQQRQAQVWAFGHSHHARLWRKTPAADQAEQVIGDSVKLDSDALYCLNVGTTGLPFPGKGGPSVALVDFKRNEIRQLALERV
jgi:predicted phosphodiesterase